MAEIKGLFRGEAWEGRGAWANARGARGEYITRFVIKEEAGAVLQVTHRTFLKDDGGVLYEEHSVIRFEPDGSNLLRVVIEHDQAEHAGAGYVWGDTVHFEVEVAEANRLENTYVFGETSIVLTGSATNEGNFTSWQERLER